MRMHPRRGFGGRLERHWERQWERHLERNRLGPRLHWQIFRALVLTGMLCFGLAMTAAWVLRDEERMPAFVQDVGDFILADMPQEQPAFQEQLEKRAGKLHASLSVWSADGKLFARVGRELGPTELTKREKRIWNHEHGESMRIRLRDGRRLAIRFADQDQHNVAWLLCGVGFVLFTLMGGSYVAARRITRRLERLERGVARFGEGALDARVQVRGRDEIARLAHVFNRSFDRIAGLLKQQRRMLQSASHELRSPLARVRMALELATEPCTPDETREKLRIDATRDIEELDALIGDLLLAGRLADTEAPKDFVEVSLWPILESETERVAATVRGQPDAVMGNPRMLRSLVRNLLENARRYGRDPVCASLEASGNDVILRVEDAGDGVPVGDRERIFEAFYRPAGHREGKDGGVGLGLSLVKSIASHHGGSVRYVAVQNGSCFEVRLPNRRISLSGERASSDPPRTMGSS